MFSSIGLFKKVKCPEAERCCLPNCIFLHLTSQDRDDQSPTILSHERISTSNHQKKKREDDQNAIDGPRKKRRIAHEESEGKASRRETSEVHNDTHHVSEPRVEAFSAKPSGKKIDQRNGMAGPVPTSRANSPFLSQPKTPGSCSIRTDAASSSTKKMGESTSQPTSAQVREKPEEYLNPRLLPHPPASHAIRFKLLALFHERVTRLNDAIKHSDMAYQLNPVMTSPEIIDYCLTAEQYYATCYPLVYLNMFKTRISALGKLTADQWIEYRQQNPLEHAIPIKAPPKGCDPKLSPSEQVTLLSLRMLAPQDTLAPFNYVPIAPNAEHIEQARQGVEACNGFEVCDRCSTRFQVFPGRRNDGVLASGGLCHYHPLRAVKSKPDWIYPCCQKPAGETGGCTAAENHVFRITDPKRLALEMAFMETPANSTPKCRDAVAFDCEMCYTTKGTEIIRLTALSWPRGEELLDVLVRPLGEILDFNTRFSGVTREDFMCAKSYSAPSPSRPRSPSPPGTPKRLQIVKDPLLARALFFTYITPSTPLIGHALENDLKAMRMIHPSIVDTVLLFPDPRGLPYRQSLKELASTFLDRHIQRSGAGHNSKEDARAAGDLVLRRLTEEWTDMQKKGWTVKDRKFIPPINDGTKQST